MWQNPYLSMLVAFGATLLSSLIVMRFSYVTGILADYKKPSISNQPIPLSQLGGVSLLFGVTTGLWVTNAPLFMYWKYLLPALPVFIAGLFRDVYKISYWWILGGQLCSIILFSLFNGYVGSHPVVYFVTLYWLFLIMTAGTMLNCLSGLATGVLLAGLFPILSFYWVVMPISWLLFVSALFASILALFALNVPRPYLYIGQSGALLMSSLYAFTLVSLPIETSVAYKPYILFLLAFIPVFEVNALFFIRLYLKKPLFKRTRHYMIDFLHDKEWDNWAILLFAMIVQVGASYAGLFLAESITWYRLVFFLGSIIFWWYQVVYSPFPFKKIKKI